MGPHGSAQRRFFRGGVTNSFEVGPCHSATGQRGTTSFLHFDHPAVDPRAGGGARWHTPRHTPALRQVLGGSAICVGQRRGRTMAHARHTLKEMSRACARRDIRDTKQRRHTMAHASAHACFATSLGRACDLCIAASSAHDGTRSAHAQRTEQGLRQTGHSRCDAMSAHDGTRLGTRLFWDKSWAPVRIC